MNRQEVKSSNMKSVGHNPKKMLMEVEFHNGDLYQYHPVTSEAFQRMLKAESVGKWFWANIRNNKAIKYNDMNA